MSRPAIAIVLIVLVTIAAAAAPARAQDPAPQSAPHTDSDQALCAAIERLVEALGQAIAGLPRYAPPEIDSHGNIILRRLNPPGPTLPRQPPPHGWTLDQTSA